RTPRKHRGSEPGASNHPDDRGVLSEPGKRCAYGSRPLAEGEGIPSYRPQLRESPEQYGGLRIREPLPLCRRLSVAVSRQGRPQRGREAAFRSAQGNRAGRGFRAVQDAASVRSLGLSGLSEPAVFIAHPVLKEGAVIGVIVLQIGNKEIYRVFGDYDGLGETGETVVATRKGDQLIFVSPLRHVRDAAFRTTVRIGEARSTAM